jgi:hypothetical protein
MRGAACDLTRAFIIDLHAEDLARTSTDDFEILVRVEVEVEDDAKASAQGRCDQSGTGCCANQGELRQFEFDGTRRWTLSDQEIQLVSSIAG